MHKYNTQKDPCARTPPSLPAPTKATLVLIHAYSNTNHIITYIHNFRTLRGFGSRIVARAGFNTIFATRFGLPVRTHVLKTAFRAAAKNVTVGLSARRSGSVGQKEFSF